MAQENKSFALSYIDEPSSSWICLAILLGIGPLAVCHHLEIGVA